LSNSDNIYNIVSKLFWTREHISQNSWYSLREGLLCKTGFVSESFWIDNLKLFISHPKNPTFVLMWVAFQMLILEEIVERLKKKNINVRNWFFYYSWSEKYTGRIKNPEFGWFFHIFSRKFFSKMILLGANFMRRINYDHCRTLKTLPWPWISLFSLQYTCLFPELGKRFQDSAMRAIDSSHRKTPIGLFWWKLKNIKNWKIDLKFFENRKILFFKSLCRKLLLFILLYYIYTNI
jgi:hypothetical protein